MQFNDKLVFLMKISQTTNKELAKGISVDPSLISLLRSGRRKRPTNPEHIKNMAKYFAGRCSAQFQRNALSELLEQHDISASMTEQALAERMEAWLLSDSRTLTRILDEADTNPPEAPVIPVSHHLDLNTPGTVFRLGTEGRNETIDEFLHTLMQSKEPGIIYVISDGELRWFLYDYAYSRKVQSQLCELARRGFVFYQIMPGFNNLTNYTMTFRFWLPVYSTGQVKVYYYPRMCDNMYRRALLIHDKCIRVSTAVGINGKNDITTFSTDPELIRAYKAQFGETLDLCRPVLKIHENLGALAPSLEAFHSMAGEHIQMVTHLPANTISDELLEKIKAECSDPVFFRLFRSIHDASKKLESMLKDHVFIDIVPLLSASELLQRKVLIGSATPITPNHPCYTPETYVLHLKHILYLMDTYENYHFVPYTEKIEDEYNLFVNDGGLALIINTSSPMILEMRQPEMIMCCREYLFEIASRLGFDYGIQKNRIRIRLENLITELQAYYNS